MRKEVVKKGIGYYQLADKLSDKEIKEYYENKYFQEAKGGYDIQYSDAEIKYIKNKQMYLQLCLEKMGISIKGKKFLDLGCGEGWTLSYFKSLDCEVKGVDFSSYAIKKFNIDVYENFIQSDIYEFLDREIKMSNKYDIINLTHVIEHVAEPEELLLNLKTIVLDGGVIIVTFPNDFSELQKQLLDLEKINEKFWITFPDHISYFTKQSFIKMIDSLDLHAELILADFPIDILLLNDHSNYIKDKSKGKQAHYTRVQTMNLLVDLSPKISLEAFLNFGQMGFGRNLAVFIKI